MTTEQITWTPVSASLPDAEQTVLVSLGPQHAEPVWLGWTDGVSWFDTDGQLCDVVAWAAMPKGARA
jgi:hypothetical protein